VMVAVPAPFEAAAHIVEAEVSWAQPRAENQRRIRDL
jgi:hypothetical protein